MRHYLLALRRLPHTLSRVEKGLLAIILIVVLATSGLWWQNLTSLWTVKPVKGGTYIEGITTSNPYDTELIASKLTKIGLTYTDSTGKINGALADHWEISEDGKTYKFFLRSGVKATEVAETYSVLPSWQNIEVKAENEETVVMTLKQPFAPLLSFTSNPDIEMGPYVLEKQSKNEMTFAANEKFILGEPNLQRIALVIYADAKSLKPALQRQEIMGADQVVTGVSGTVTKKMELTKQTVLLFNQDRAALKDIKIRQQLRDNQRIDNPPALTLVTSQDPALLEKANQFAAKARESGWTIDIKSLNAIALERDALANDDYDLLLTELNYGYDEDPYPYWHSSQIIAPGKNYAGYNSKEGDKLMEEARQTLDTNERHKKYEEFQKILERDTPAIFYPKETYQYTITNRVKGVKEGVGAVPADRFTEVWNWFIKAKKEK
jgi:ABC-type transport system substrate-binding protein